MRSRYGTWTYGREHDPHDTQGSPENAKAVARAPIQGGDGIILSPPPSGDTVTVAPIARSAGIPMLAFTSDAARVQPGMWLLGITPDQQIRRLISAASADGRNRFAALLLDGHARRGLAAFRIDPGGTSHTVTPAPTSLSAPVV